MINTKVTPKVSFEVMIEQATERGYSEIVKDYSLVPGATGLESAYADFFADNPELAAEFGIGDVAEKAIDFRAEVIRPVIRSLGVELIKVYSVSYDVDDEGTGLHNDADTGADLIVVRTVFGSAEFTCHGVDRDAGVLSQIVEAGDVVAFRSDMQHAAGAPIGGPRQIEGWAIRL